MSRSTKTDCPLEPVAWVGDELVITCAECGEIGRRSPARALGLADELEGPLGRFVIAAPRAQRFALAAELREAVLGRESSDRRPKFQVKWGPGPS